MQFLPAYDAIREPRQAAGAAGADGEAALRAGRRAAGADGIHRRLACPWAKKGVVMRVLNERLAGRDLDLTDGIKLIDEGGWSRVLPDPDEPLVHIYAEGETKEASGEARARVRQLVEEIMQGDADATRASVEAQAEVDPSARVLLYFVVEPSTKGVMEPLLILATLSDDDLKTLIERLTQEENEVSFRRRLLQGRIDILRAERTARHEGQGRLRRRRGGADRHPLLAQRPSSEEGA